MPLLEINDLKVTFRTSRGKLKAVSGVDISADKGEIVGIVGESGCGKTVSALSVVGLLPERGEAKGKIFLDGTDLLALSPDEMRRVRGEKISMIFQEPMAALNPVLDIGKQICEPLVRNGGMFHSAARARAIEMLEMVRVPNPEERMSSYPHQLSGGLCQRVMIAMALIREPRLLVADEPTTALDVTIQAQILDLLRDLRDKTGTGILFITHDLGVVAEICDKVYVMYAGHIMEEGDVYQLFDNPMHPYTYGLMKSIPDADAETTPAAREPLYSIPGMVPSLSELPHGCPFSPRCPDRSDLCVQLISPLVRVSKTHAVRCWKYSDSCGSYDAKGGTLANG